MKYNYVKTILGISLAVCTLYGTARGAYAAAVNTDTAYVASTAGSSVGSSVESKVGSSAAPSSSSSSAQSSAAGSKKRKKGTEPSTEQSIEQQTPSSEAITPASEGSSPGVTLNDYLSKLRCGGCGKNCSLLNPRCRNGMQKANSAKQEYYSTYGS